MESTDEKEYAKCCAYRHMVSTDAGKALSLYRLQNVRNLVSCVFRLCRVPSANPIRKVLCQSLVSTANCPATESVLPLIFELPHILGDIDSAPTSLSIPGVEGLLDSRPFSPPGQPIWYSVVYARNMCGTYFEIVCRTPISDLSHYVQHTMIF